MKTLKVRVAEEELKSATNKAIRQVNKLFNYKRAELSTETPDVVIDIGFVVLDGKSMVSHLKVTREYSIISINERLKWKTRWYHLFRLNATAHIYKHLIKLAFA